ncbi:hypothetical protein COV18_00015 [Candidatus Woesearchaeota archaeon CG10_big_fil_rev_8_21_14_0_10_37_12]|nr:MAG: hypothetical protein COV18_00015 [Candidatus Woesearchaeota archaeon CG10_big_fil_rev_8_21_14_0_10_37_12]
MDLEQLKELGLSDGQITVYSAVLELGTSTLSTIQKKTGIGRRNIYDNLNKLIEKGFVTYIIKEGKKAYTCTHPNKIQEDIEIKKKALEQLEKQIPQITAFFKEVKLETQITVFRGSESIKALLNEALTYDSTYWIGGSSGIEQTTLRAWFKEWMLRREKQNKQMYDLSTQGTHLEEYHTTETEKNKKQNYHYKTLPEDILSFTTILVFGNKVVQILWNKQPFAFVLESKEVKESYLRFFNHFWKEAPTKIGTKNPIKIGVIHSLTGTMAISESSLVDATLMAVDQINQQGGILGRKIECAFVDGKSNEQTFAEEAERLITQEEVCSIFGGWTSASRKTMKPLFEKYNNLLWYPVEYEGLEDSPNIIYLGSTTNQQVLPAIQWGAKTLGKKIFLIGSDYLFPRSVNELVKIYAQNNDLTIVGEEYRILGDEHFETVVKNIKRTKPDFILNTINGDSNVAFFKELKKQNVTPDKIPTISTSIAEDEIRHLPVENMEGHYAAWNYFQSLDNKENKKFVDAFKKRYGPHRVTSDAMEKAFLAVHLFTKAVQKAGTDNVNDIREAVKGLTMDTPEGLITINKTTNHITTISRIGRVTKEGQFEMIWSSKEPIIAEPYPQFKTKEEWNAFTNKLHHDWGRKWAKEESEQ